MDNIVKLKGGSLNSTCLHTNESTAFVRKLISTNTDREYGYVRWYSQLKKLQRFNTMFPGLTPQVLDVGVNDAGAYFDIEYISDATDVKTLFVNNQLTGTQLSNLHTSLWNAFDRLHSVTYKHNPTSLGLYFKEEVDQKLADARKFQEFESFYQLDQYEYFGKTVPGLKENFEKFKSLFSTQIDSECYVHGNPTLENILYSPSTNKITFIDLYEEGIVDSKYADYSQVLQCSNSYYGIYNDNIKLVEGNVVQSTVAIPEELKAFNILFSTEIINRYGDDKHRLVKLFEATQFFRMLPFKCHAGDFTAAKFFYAHACYLVNQLL